MKKCNLKYQICFNKRLFFLAILSLLYTHNVNAQPGTLDSSFGINGISNIEGLGYVRSTALQADGKIIVVGREISESVVTIARYNTDGSLDESFGDNGIVYTDLKNSHQFYAANFEDVAIQSDGKIVVTGSGFYDDIQGNFYDALTIRYNTDGSMDESFGDRGAVISDFEDDHDEAKKIAIQSDGKIVIGGISGGYYFIARYNTDGSLDNSFNTENGWVKGSLGGVTLFTSLALQEDAKIVISCNISDAGSLIRYKSNGTKDSSFGVNGTVRGNPSLHNFIQNIIIQGDGKILAVGKSLNYDLNKYNAIVMRYELSGEFDTTFGEAGIMTVVYESANTVGSNILLQEDKKIVISGGFYTSDGSVKKGTLTRFNKDGSLNDHFGNGGIAETIFSNLANILIQPDGKIIARGSLTNGSSFTYTLSRFKADNEPSPEFAKIKKWLHKHGFTWDDFPHLAPGGSIHVERSANGNIFTTIASIAAHNNSQPYSFEDPAPLAGTNYYRLTATASDGSNVSSNVIAIGNSDAASVKIFPNPVKNSLQVTGLSATQKTTLSITDLSGAGRAAVTITGSSYNWNIGQLKAGSYILRIENGDLVVSKMFIKD